MHSHALGYKSLKSYSGQIKRSHLWIKVCLQRITQFAVLKCNIKCCSSSQEKKPRNIWMSIWSYVLEAFRKHRLRLILKSANANRIIICCQVKVWHTGAHLACQQILEQSCTEAFVAGITNLHSTVWTAHQLGLELFAFPLQHWVKVAEGLLFFKILSRSLLTKGHRPIFSPHFTEGICFQSFQQNS